MWGSGGHKVWSIGEVTKCGVVWVTKCGVTGVTKCGGVTNCGVLERSQSVG